MNFIEIEDTEGNIHLFNPNHIAAISDIQEYRIITLSTSESTSIVTDIEFGVIKSKINQIQQKWQNINLNGGMSPYS